jgi:hypothetical protein
MASHAQRLKRIYGPHHLHLSPAVAANGSPLGSAHSRDVFLRIFEQVRRKYCFEVVGYLVMPEHFHFLIGKPEIGTPSTLLQVSKQSVAPASAAASPRKPESFQLGGYGKKEAALVRDSQRLLLARND